MTEINKLNVLFQFFLNHQQNVHITDINTTSAAVRWLAPDNNPPFTYMYNGHYWPQSDFKQMSNLEEL